MSTGKDLTVINALLDAAKEKHGSDYKVAKLLGRQTQEISDMRHGRLTAQPEDHALIASLGGLDAEEALVRAVIAKHAGKPKGERLLSVLGNVLRRTGEAVTLGFFGSAVLATNPRNAEAAANLMHQTTSADGWNLLTALATMCRRVDQWRQSGDCQMATT